MQNKSGEAASLPIKYSLQPFRIMLCKQKLMPFTPPKDER